MKLINGESYKLIYSNSFCNVNSYNGKNVDVVNSKLLGDGLTVQYVGQVETNAGYRHIFYHDDLHSYIMYSVGSEKSFIVDEKKEEYLKLKAQLEALAKELGIQV